MERVEGAIQVLEDGDADTVEIRYQYRGSDYHESFFVTHKEARQLLGLPRSICQEPSAS